MGNGDLRAHREGFDGAWRGAGTRDPIAPADWQRTHDARSVLPRAAGHVEGDHRREAICERE